MAADRVAEDREGADEILAVEPAGSHQSASAGGHRQTALGHRARLRGTEAGNRTGTLCRTQLARISSSRHALHCRLWILGAGAVPFSPCTRFAATAGSRPPASPTPYATQLHVPRRCRCERDDIIHPRSPPCAAKSPPTWPAPCPGVPAACEASYNTVVLAARGESDVIQKTASKTKSHPMNTGTYDRRCGLACGFESFTTG